MEFSSTPSSATHCSNNAKCSSMLSYKKNKNKNWYSPFYLKKTTNIKISFMMVTKGIIAWPALNPRNFHNQINLEHFGTFFFYRTSIIQQVLVGTNNFSFTQFTPEVSFLLTPFDTWDCYYFKSDLSLLMHECYFQKNVTLFWSLQSLKK